MRTGLGTIDTRLMRRVLPGLGRMIFGAGLVGLGVLNLLYGDFALQWQPAPDNLPLRGLLASGNGLFSIAAGICLWLRPAMLLGAVTAAVLCLVWVMAFHLPKVLAGEAAAWLAFFECIALVGGSLILVGRPVRERSSALPGKRAGPVGSMVGRYLFALSLPAFGASHFIYPDGAAALVPGWLPAPAFWAQLTGLAHIAAGMALVSNLFSRLASILLAVMFTLFVLVLHAPRVVMAVEDRVEWTMLCIALALTGAAWTVAAAVWQNAGAQR